VKTNELEELRAALIEGEQSGASTPFDFENFITVKRSEGQGDHASLGEETPRP
jgi:hypothetical protein